MPSEPGSGPVRDDLEYRRERLQAAMSGSPGDAEIGRLLARVDAALERIDDGTWGLCEACHEPIEADRILSDPLTCFCLDHLSEQQQQALEHDLALAARIQRRLLPEESLRTAGWAAAYRYAPAGAVSGDYCDLVALDGSVYFFVGDVSGKGVSAAMLMSHLHATLRALLAQGLALDDVMDRASRMLCENTLPSHFATMAAGRAVGAGEVQLCLAGHTPVLLAQGDEVKTVDSTALPLGMFGDQRFALSAVTLAPGETLLLYTDGISEAQDASGAEYGVERIARLLDEHRAAPLEAVVSACLDAVGRFRSPLSAIDDATVMAIRRVAGRT